MYIVRGLIQKKCHYHLFVASLNIVNSFFRGFLEIEGLDVKFKINIVSFDWPQFI